MKVIGINYLSESSVCLVENGIVKYAISEERLNRKKKTGMGYLMRVLKNY